MKKSKLALFQSVIALILCISMLMGTTFAWFTDSVTSENNIIVSGKLDAGLYWTDDVTPAEGEIQWNDAEKGTIFDYSLWEPGFSQMKYVKITNEGNLAFRYQLQVLPNVPAEAGEADLAEVIDVYFGIVDENFTEPVYFSAEMAGMTRLGTLAEVMNHADGAASGVLLPENGAGTLPDGVTAPVGEVTACILLHMQESAGNEYQNLDVGGGFRVMLLATQFTYENDSFGNDYDSDAGFSFPDGFISAEISGDVNVTDNKVAEDVTLDGGLVSAQVPAGVQVSEGTDKLTLSVSEKEETESNLTLGANEELRPLDVHVEGVAADNTQPMEIFIGRVAPVGLNKGNLKLYHVENGVSVPMTEVEEFTAHNQFKYNPATGDVTLYMATFSEVTILADTVNPWKGAVDHSWYVGESSPYAIANADQLWSFSQIVGGMAEGIDQSSFSDKTVKLISDINLGYGEGESYTIFYPIGYYNSTKSYEKVSGGSVTSTVYSFEGTFDGQGHTIANFYQNTWEMFGDYNDGYSGTPNHYKDGMGLFGYVKGGTVKNLTVSNFSSDGEFTPTGVIAAFADGDATFENIAIVGCNPRVYNTGNGGIIGIAGDTSAVNDDHITLKNITVDNSNKISALWGSWDVACGGLVGMYRGNVDGNGNATGDTISFTNCHVAAQIDVYNDVCGNYQYYAYRYAGMIIGSVRHNTTKDGKTIPNMTGISASGCTVNYGDWNDYYYCEFEENTMASYSEDYQFSRVPNSEIDTTNGKENATCIGHDHTEAEDKQAVYLPFHQLFTGYSWGVSSIGLQQYSGITVQSFGLDIEEGDQEESVEKFDVIPEMGAQALAESANEVTVTIGTLFAAKANVNPAINIAAVQVAVTGLNNSGITAEYSADATDWTLGTLTFNKTEGLCAVTIQDYNFCKPTTIYLENGKLTSVEKFNIKLPNVATYLYRVGNQNPVKLGWLFEEAGVPVNDSNVNVDTTQGTYSADTSTWENGTLNFSGYTGLVTVTISEGDYAKILDLEVVDAWNTVTATNATNKNVVLLDDCGFSSLEVSGGYSLYGNGFTMTCGSDSVALDMGYGFVTLNHGTLDNVQIVCPNFDYSVLYASNRKDTGNYSETDTKGTIRYGNVKSAVIVSGNSRILDSRISGGRAAVYATNGNIVLDNTRVELGAAANIHVGAAVTGLTLKNVTLVQKPTQANVRDSSNTIMGLSVVAMTDSNGNAAPITIEGELNQYAWAHEGYVEYVPEKGQDMVDDVLSQQDYIHSINYEDGVARDSVNLGIVFMPDETTANKPTITDNRVNHPYSLIQVGVVGMKAWIYTVGNSNITGNQGSATDMGNVPGYESNEQGEVLPVLEYSDVNEDRVFTSSYDVEKGWIYKLTVNLDNGAYTFDFSNLAMKQAGNAVTYSRPDGVSSSIDVSEGTEEYVLTANIEGVEHKVYFQLIGTASSKEAPQWSKDNSGSTLSTSMNAVWADGVCVATYYGGNFSGAAPALTNVYVRYYSTEAKDYKVINLADYTPTTKGKFDGTDTTCTIQGPDFTLTLTGGQVHSSNKINAMPVVIQSDSTYTLYFVASSDSGLVKTGNTARTVPVTYTFTDNLGNTLSGSHTWSVAEDKSNEYKYSDFCNGTMTKLKSCVTGDTMVMLADGTEKRIDQVTYEDQLRVWNFYTGEYAVAPAACIWNHGYAWNNIIKLTFSDGTVTKAVNEHGYFDATLNEFVMITADNAEEYIGHEFVKEDGNSYTTVTLVSAEVSEEYIEAYSILTAYYYNFITDRMFSLTSPVIETNFFMPYEVGENMTFDAEKMAEDIEKYGLYEYADFEGQMPYEVFECLNIKHLKVAAGKGLITYDQIIELLRSEGIVG